MFKTESIIEQQLGPKEITIKNVVHWCRHTKELKGSQRSKALKFVEFNCVRYMGKTFVYDLRERFPGKYDDAKNIFLCLPLNTKDSHRFLGNIIEKTPTDVDYNHSEYIMYQDKDRFWHCNCQGYQTKEKDNDLPIDGVGCSHLLSLMFCFKLKLFGRHPGVSQGLNRSDLGGFEK